MTAPTATALINILDRIAAIQAAITVPGLDQPSILYAEAFPPSNMSAVQCPFFVNQLAPSGTSDPYASTQYRDFKVLMDLCILRKEGAENLKLATRLVAYWIDAVYSAFAAHVRLSDPVYSIADIANVLDSWIEAWKMIEITYGDVTFLGLEFTLSVRELYAQVLAA